MPRRKPAASPADQPQSERRQRILAAAAAVFARHGYHRARTREIAAEAGVAEGTIFNYFPTKRDLLFAMIEQTVVESMPDLMAHVDQGDIVASLQALALDRLALVDRNRQLFLAVAPELFSDAELREAFVRQVVAPTLKWLLPAVLRLLDRPEVRPVNPRVALPAFMGGLVLSFVANSILELPTGPQLTKEQIAAEIARLFADGLLVRGSSVASNDNPR